MLFDPVFLTSPDFASRTGPVAIVPIGAFEQHGSHLPLNTDSLIAELLARGLSARVGGVSLPVQLVRLRQRVQRWSPPCVTGWRPIYQVCSVVCPVRSHGFAARVTWRLFVPCCSPS